MKKFEEVMKEIETIRAAIKESEAAEKEIEAKWIGEDNRAARHEIFEALAGDLAAVQARSKDLRIAFHLMQNNARVALYHECMPALLAILEKYKGKPYGEKTRSKIADEMEAATGARVYIGTRYNQEEIVIYPASGVGRHGNYQIECGPVFNSTTGDYKRLLIDNKIQSLSISDFSLWYIKTDFVEDIPAAIAKMKEAHARAVQLKRELDAACKDFNAYAVQGIEEITERRIYDKIMIN